jgi:hypothetical protein
MIFTFEMDGGFAYLPALNRPVTTDTTMIDPQVAKQLEFFVRESRFFDQPTRVDTVTKGSADYLTYTITVQDGSRVHTVQMTDPITDANLERLVALLRLIAHPTTR